MNDTVSTIPAILGDVLGCMNALLNECGQSLEETDAENEKSIRRFQSACQALIDTFRSTVDVNTKPLTKKVRLILASLLASLINIKNKLGQSQNGLKQITLDITKRTRRLEFADYSQQIQRLEQAVAESETALNKFAKRIPKRGRICCDTD